MCCHQVDASVNWHLFTVPNTVLESCGKSLSVSFICVAQFTQEKTKKENAYLVVKEGKYRLLIVVTAATHPTGV